MPHDDVQPSADAPSLRARLGNRWRIILGGACFALLLGGLLWVVVTGLVARARMQDVGHRLHTIRAAVADGNVSDAEQAVRAMRADVASAHALTSGPAWWIAANIPYVGAPARTSRVVTGQADVVGSRVLPGVVELVHDLVRSTDVHGSGVNIAALAKDEPTLRAAATTAADATGSIRRSAPTWFGPVNSGRDYAVRELTKVSGQLLGADKAVRLAMPMLGESGTRRYFIGFLNEAESRGVGGIPGAFAIATVDRGHLTFDHFGSDTELQHVRADVHLGAEYNARYGQDDPAGVIQNSDISPDFRYAAQIWAGMWTTKTGQHIDGALAVDPTALSYLLYAVGDVKSANKSAVTTDSIVSLTQQQQYSLYPDVSVQATTARKNYLINIARSAVAKLTIGGHFSQLLHAFTRAAGERRLVLWSARPAEERGIVAAGYGGVLQAGAGAFTGMSVDNAAGSKLDFYLRRSLTYSRSECGAGSTSTATMTLTNGAPRSGLPAYVTFRADRPKGPVHRGDNLLLVTYYGTAGSRIRTVTLDGKPVHVASGLENGLTAVTVAVELPVQTTRTLRVTLSEPAAHGPVEVLRQPGVQDLVTHLHSPKCQ